MKKALFLIIIFLLSYSNLLADAGTTSAAFLKIGVGARNLAMGSVGSVEKSADSVYYNPAGLAYLDCNELSLMHLSWFTDITYDYASFAFPYKEWGLAVAYQNLQVGSIQEYDVNDNKLNASYSPSDSLLTVSASRFLRKDLSAGASLKYINSNIESANASTIAGDAGMIYSGIKHFDFGIAIQNFGGKLTYVQTPEDLPLNFKAGVGYYMDPIRNMLPKFFLDINQPIETKPYVSIGSEVIFHLKDNIGAALRAGYRTQTTNNGVNGFSAGGGIILYKNIEIDFAWVPYGELGDTYAMSLNYKFLCPKKKELEKPAEKPIEKPVVKIQQIVLNGIAQSSNEIVWNWNKIDDATEYRIYDCQDNSLMKSFSSDTTTWMETGLKANTTYTMRVVAFDKNSESLSKGECAVATLPAEIVLQGMAQSSDAIIWSWNRIAGASEYRTYDCKDNSLMKSFASDTTSWLETGLKANTTYAMRIVAFDKNSESISKSECAVATLPVGIVVQGIAQSSDEIIWSWNRVVGTSEYRTYDGKDNSLKKSFSRGTSSWIETGLKANTTYTMRVVAFDKNSDIIAQGECVVVTLPIIEAIKREVQKVQFLTGKWNIREKFKPGLNKAAAMIIEMKPGKVIVAGHTDNRGNPKSNKELGQKRANSVKEYLAKKGVPENTMQVEAYGAEDSLFSNETAAGREMNRRVEIKIVQ